MKPWVLLFACYFLMLSILPCQDGLLDILPAQTTQINNQQEASHDAEHCSPFCICQCCGLHSFTQTPTTTLSYELRFSTLKPNSLLLLFYSTAYGKAVWQPPQMAS